ncbi:MAG: UDP-N-acetylmuramoyl-L-alanyl-D-glutamate--2,6-diaminopimelate ligase [Spirosomaceae bacterium]|nr:UDP-N-acetylmuramoyl-L-alanyl-D-glutamate--2,6-diaminopimelate ligase [Spirosomataceae bacterium]
MILSDLLYKIPLKSVAGKTDSEIKNIIFDSRKVENGSLFVAIGGTQVDGHNFIDTAIEKGASAILCEKLPEQLHESITYIQVENSARAMGFAASNFYGNPSSKLHLIGVTGTNGKTSTVTLLFGLFRRLGHRCGLLSTVQNQIEDEIIESTHTTPDSVEINRLLSEMLKKGATYCFMEVSSHSVVQERIAGLTFRGGIFTNITHDHLDFHGTFENYIKAKKGFFDQLPKTAFALVNTDDKNGKVMLQNTAARKETLSLNSIGTFKGKILANTLFGLEMDIDGKQVWFKLIGAFNAYNLLGVYGSAVLMGEDPDEVLTQLSGIKPPPGRFEQVVSENEIVGIVDYAHTPDALENVLKTINEIKEGNQKVITVVGCGGDRDKTKRPIMAKIATEMSDMVILTSDNPRTEDPNEILEQMQAGVSFANKKKTETIEDRRAAIQKAVSLAKPHDIILVAGKGHEDYQIIGKTKHHFDDREELRKAF